MVVVNTTNHTGSNTNHPDIIAEKLEDAVALRQYTSNSTLEAMEKASKSRHHQISEEQMSHPSQSQRLDQLQSVPTNLDNINISRSSIDAIEQLQDASKHLVMLNTDAYDLVTLEPL